MEKVTVNGKSDVGKDIYDVGKEKSYINIFEFEEEEGESNNGKIQWKIPRIQQKSAYN